MIPEITSENERTRVLMVGYNGANNTGAEALLQADIEDLRAVFGAGVHITVPTLNETNLRRYLHESATLTIAPIPSLYFGAIRRLVKESDLVLLAEGSTYMDTWGSPLLWLFLWATHCATKMGKPSLAYAVDAGALSRANQKRVRNIASSTSLIVTRNRAAADRLRGIGVTAPIECTADNAFTFTPKLSDGGWLAREWPLAGRGVAGLAMVDFTLFPAVMRLWAPKVRCYRWPYYFSGSPQRRRFSEKLAGVFAALADHIVESTGKAVALICMEQLDEAFAAHVQRRMRHPEHARQFSARNYDASQMTLLLRGLDLLVTSRYHAAVLSLAAGVPQVAIGHDTRLSTIYHDLGLRERWFMEPCAKGRADWEFFGTQFFTELRERVDLLLNDPGLQKEKLDRGYSEHFERARRNRKLLSAFAAKQMAEFGVSGSKGAIAADVAIPPQENGGMKCAA